MATSHFLLALALWCLHCAHNSSPTPVDTIRETLQQRLSATLDAIGLLDPVDAAAFNNPVPVSTTQSLALATIADAQYYALYALGANYCYGSPLLTNWTCGPCRKLGPSVRFYSTLYNASTGVAGFITLDEEAEEIAVTFRGSYAAQNFVLDLMTTPVPFVGVNEDVRVHQGYLLCLNSIYDQLRAKLQALNTDHPDYRIVFSGHSLGAAVATLALLKTRSEAAFRARTFAHFSYGEPRLGDHTFAQWVNAMNWTAARVVNYDDVVPHIFPPTDVYTHFGTEFWIESLGSNATRICGRSTTEDSTCSNSVAPLYNILEHLSYYGNSVLDCPAEDPVNALLQLA